MPMLNTCLLASQDSVQAYNHILFMNSTSTYFREPTVGMVAIGPADSAQSFCPGHPLNINSTQLKFLYTQEDNLTKFLQSAVANGGSTWGDSSHEVNVVMVWNGIQYPAAFINGEFSLPLPQHASLKGMQTNAMMFVFLRKCAVTIQDTFITKTSFLNHVDATKNPLSF